MKVLVTGGAGKIGRWVVAVLQEVHQVRVLDRVVEGVATEAVQGDLLDRQAVAEAMVGMEVVIHLAGVPKHGAAPDAEIIATNVLGTYNVHELAAEEGVRRVVSTSSEAALGWDFHMHSFLPDYLPVDESHQLQPQDSYGLSKLLGEEIAASFHRTGRLETLVLRPSWILSPDEMTALSASCGFSPRAFSLCNYIDARDLADAYLRAVDCVLDDFEAVFVTADDSYVAEPLAQVLPRLQPGCEALARELTGNQAALSNRRAKELLGWRPCRGWRNVTDSA